MFALPEALIKFSGKAFHEFGLDEVKCSLDRDCTLSVRLGHYKLPGIIEVQFEEVLYHAVMLESHIYMHEEDGWERDAFLARASSSQLISHLAKYTLLEAMLDGVESAKHFRIIGQNFFVEVVAMDEPSFRLACDA